MGLLTLREVQDIFVVFCPDGCLKLADMPQCKNEKWVPIASLKQGEQVNVFCFTDAETARKFGKRNYPKDWTKGVIALSKLEVEWIVAKGWKFMLLNFPRLFKDIEGFGYEILEFQTEPDLFMQR